MSFSLIIEGQFETLMNFHPKYGNTGGDALLAFLTGLNKPLSESCQPLLDAMWGDGEDPVRYLEDEIEFYRKRNLTPITEDEFKMYLQGYRDSEQPIKAVRRAVQMLLETLKGLSAEDKISSYQPKHIVESLEALLYNLDLLISRGNRTVRLNFN